MPYSVEFAPRAVREFKKLTPEIQKSVGARITGLAANPRPRGVEKLAGGENLYRIREGEYRIVYEIRDRKLIVLVVSIGHRRDVYRRL